MKDAEIKRTWIETACSIQKFHIQKMKEHINWREIHTAKALNRSLGSVSQYLTIASWLKTHERQIRSCDTLKEALEFIKSKKRDQAITETDA